MSQTPLLYLVRGQIPIHSSYLLLEKDTTPKGYKMSMFLRPKDKDLELWEGARTGLQGAIDLFGADEVCDRVLDTNSHPSGLFHSRIGFSLTTHGLAHR